MGLAHVGAAGTLRVAPSVAPDNAWLGIMLPYTPLHHLLMRELGFPVVATSGNRSAEPIVADEDEALARLAGVADWFLVHDRPILHPVDDSVVRTIAGRPTVLRLARGLAPQPLRAPFAAAPVLALGTHQKNAVAVAADGQIVLGAHVGDLDDAETRLAFERAVDTMSTLYRVDAPLPVCDKHPDYYTTSFARHQAVPVRVVQHHVAHVLAGMIDNGLDGPVLGVAWDGSGDGGDRTVWGGEFIEVCGNRYRHAGRLARFRLPGGEAAVREPRRCAIGALHATFGDAVFGMTRLAPVAGFTPRERHVLASMLGHALCAPATSSAGRLFDAVAAIVGLHQTTSFEGQAAIALESAAERARVPCALAQPVVARDGALLVADWRPVLASLVDAYLQGTSPDVLAAAFHDALAGLVVAIAKRVGIERVLLTGGCFQNARLTAHTVDALHTAGFAPYWHHRVPPNDGGVAVGQAAFAARALFEETV